MAKTANIALNITPESEDTKPFKTWRTEMAGDASDTNMQIIDAEIGKIHNGVIFSPTQPTTQLQGDVWNEIL